MAETPFQAAFAAQQYFESGCQSQVPKNKNRSNNKKPLAETTETQFQKNDTPRGNIRVGNTRSLINKTVFAVKLVNENMGLSRSRLMVSNISQHFKVRLRNTFLHQPHHCKIHNKQFVGTNEQCFFWLSSPYTLHPGFVNATRKRRGT